MKKYSSFDEEFKRDLIARITNYRHIFEMNGESYRLKRSKKERRKIT